MIYLAPWKWDTTDDLPHWRSPFATTVGCLDLRSTPQIKPGIAEGWGLFVTRDPETVPDAIPLGTDFDDIADRALIQRELSLGEALVKASVGGVLFEILTQHADPTTVSRWGNIMPGADGRLSLWIAGRLVAWQAVRDTNGSMWTPVRNRERLNYGRIKALVTAGVYPAGKHQMYLGGLLRKYRTQNHEQFIPLGVPSELPRKPQTTNSDDFNRANENLEVSADWALLNATTGTSSFVVNTNRCREDSTTPSNSAAQHQTALSSDDHFAEVTIEALTAPGSTRSYGGPMVRVSDGGSGVVNGYGYQATIDSVGVKRGRLGKWTGATPTFTAILDEVETIALTDTIYCEASGSNIGGKINGTFTAGPTADGSLSGQLNNGLESRIFAGSVGDIEMDNFSGGDLAAAGGYTSSLTLVGVG